MEVNFPSKKYPYGVIHRGDNFDVAFAEYVFANKGTVLHEIASVLNDKHFPIAATGETYRIINHWDSESLLLSDRKSDKGWRKFSLVDLVWIQTVSTLRQYGFSHDQIRSTKKCIVRTLPMFGSVLLFEFYILLCKRKIDIGIIVFDDGSADIGTREEIAMSEQLQAIPSYLFISLNALWDKAVLEDIKAPNKVQISVDANQNEIISLIRSGEVDELVVTFENGKIKKYSQVTFEKNREEIISLLKKLPNDEGAFDIEVKAQDGKLLSLKRIKKKKM